MTDGFATFYAGWLKQRSLKHGAVALEEIVSSFPAFFGRDGWLFLRGYRRWVEREGRLDTEDSFADYCEPRCRVWKENHSKEQLQHTH